LLSLQIESQQRVSKHRIQNRIPLTLRLMPDTPSGMHGDHGKEGLVCLTKSDPFSLERLVSPYWPLPALLVNPPKTIHKSTGQNKPIPSLLQGPICLALRIKREWLLILKTGLCYFLTWTSRELSPFSFSQKRFSSWPHMIIPPSTHFTKRFKYFLGLLKWSLFRCTNPVSPSFLAPLDYFWLLALVRFLLFFMLFSVVNWII
jgi:hypothetical protein